MRSILFLLFSALLFSSCGKKYATHEAVDLPDLVPYKEGQRWGFADTSGDLRIKARYDSVTFFHHGIAKVYLNKDGWKRIGFINTEGEEIIPVEYDDIRWLHWEENIPYLPVKKGEHYGVMSRKGRKIVPCNYHEVDYNRSGYFLVALKRDKEKSYGIYDSTGKIIFEPVYKHILSDEENKRKLYGVAFNEKFGLFDERGNPLTGFDYDMIYILNPNSAAYFTKGASFTEPIFGLMDAKGNKITEPVYGDVHVLNDTLLLTMKKNEQTGTTVVIQIINHKGRVIHENRYFRAEQKGRERIMLSQVNSKSGFSYGLADLGGRLMIPVENEQLVWLEGGTIILRKDTLAALVDSNGKALIPFKFHQIYSMGKRYFQVVDAEGYSGVYSRTGKKLVNVEYDVVDVFRDSIIKVKKGRKYSYFFPDGQPITPRKMLESFYDSVSTYDMGNGVTFREELTCGRYVVSKDDRYYLTDIKGKIDRKNDFDSIRRFRGGLAVYVEKDRLGLIDSLGNVLTDPVYDYIQPDPSGTSIVYAMNNDKDGLYYGLVDYKGKKLTDLEYDRIEAWKEGLFKAYGPNDVFLGFLDYRGKRYFKGK